MRVLLVSAEVSPYAKAGGLADVAGSLPDEIYKLGHEVKVFMPFYGSIDTETYKVKKIDNADISITFGNKEIKLSIYKAKTKKDSADVYFIDNFEYFKSHGEIYSRNNPKFEHERFIVFSKAAIEFSKKLEYKPDIIHCNDWHTAPICTYLKNNYADDEFFENTKIIFSIHNLAYQGIYGQEILGFAGIKPELGHDINALEFYGDVNWLKGALIYSDKITTVSEKYAEEIQTPEYGEKLENLLLQENQKLTGILNGLNYKLFDPSTDKTIKKKYSAKNLKGKADCKIELQKLFHLKQDSKIPLIGIVTRLVNQKGLDLIAETIEKLKNENLQLAVLGSGEEKYEDLFRNLNAETNNIKSFIGFDANLAQKIYAGADIFLMPSKFEPCGLGQIIALSYGSIPIVRKTGGLSDTITDIGVHFEKGNGFVFENYNPDDLYHTIMRALNHYKEKKEWEHLVKNAMSQKFGWDTSAHKYIDLYKSTIELSEKS